MSFFEGLIFTPNTTKIKCRQILITNDIIAEGDEVFDVELNTTDEAVILKPNATFITIIDDDSKYILSN